MHTFSRSFHWLRENLFGAYFLEEKFRKDERKLKPVSNTKKSVGIHGLMNASERRFSSRRNNKFRGFSLSLNKSVRFPANYRIPLNGKLTTCRQILDTLHFLFETS